MRDTGVRASLLLPIGNRNCNYNRTNLKRRLIKDGLLENKCSECGQVSKWNGKDLIMIIDHINGVNNDNRLENLRMLCPNCNTQQDTFCGKKNRGKKRIDFENKCIRCGTVISRGAKRCLDCSRIEMRKTERPTKDILERMIHKIPMEKIGSKYDVSGRTIKNWCDDCGIVMPPRKGRWSRTAI